jgi:hypothetical protein
MSMSMPTRAVCTLSNICVAYNSRRRGRQPARGEARPAEPECMDYRLLYRKIGVNIYRKSTGRVTVAFRAPETVLPVAVN